MFLHPRPPKWVIWIGFRGSREQHELRLFANSRCFFGQRLRLSVNERLTLLQLDRTLRLIQLVQSIQMNHGGNFHSWPQYQKKSTNLPEAAMKRERRRRGESCTSYLCAYMYVSALHLTVAWQTSALVISLLQWLIPGGGGRPSWCASCSGPHVRGTSAFGNRFFCVWLTCR